MSSEWYWEQFSSREAMDARLDGLLNQQGYNFRAHVRWSYGLWYLIYTVWTVDGYFIIPGSDIFIPDFVCYEEVEALEIVDSIILNGDVYNPWIYNIYDGVGAVNPRFDLEDEDVIGVEVETYRDKTIVYKMVRDEYSTQQDRYTSYPEVCEVARAKVRGER
jgi:hypothetical protein